jgi:hypothetical protein
MIEKKSVTLPQDKTMYILTQYIYICNPKWWVCIFYIFSPPYIIFYNLTWHTYIKITFLKNLKKMCGNLFLHCLDELIYNWYALTCVDMHWHAFTSIHKWLWLTCIMKSLTQFLGDSSEHLWRHQTQIWDTLWWSWWTAKHSRYCWRKVYMI